MDYSPNQIVSEAYNETGAFGIGQTPRASDLSAGLTRLGLMLSEWQHQKYLVQRQMGATFVATPGKYVYTVGPGGDIDTDVRPDRLESMFYRIATGTNASAVAGDGIGQFKIGISAIGVSTVVGSSSLLVDYPMRLLQATEDYQRIRLKGLGGVPEAVFYDPVWPVGQMFVWPAPAAQGRAALFGVNWLQPLPHDFAAQPDTVFSLPPIYYNTLVLCLAVRLCSRMRVQVPPELALGAKQSLAVLRGANAKVPELVMPSGLSRGASYNIWGGT